MQVLSWFGLSRALGSDLPCPGFHFLCVSFLARLAKQRGVSIQRLRHVRVFWAQVLLPDRHHSLVEGLCLGVLALIIVEQRQVAQTYGKYSEAEPLYKRVVAIPEERSEEHTSELPSRPHLVC